MRSGINTVLISLVPLQFAKAGRSSTVAGLTNAFTYLGSALSRLGAGTGGRAVGLERGQLAAVRAVRRRDGAVPGGAAAVAAVFRTVENPSAEPAVPAEGFLVFLLRSGQGGCGGRGNLVFLPIL